jgi:putative membrane protein
MAAISTIATALIAALHVYILYLEMFLWTTPRGQKAFKLTAEFARQTAVLAANQGLYNGLLAAGLAWSAFHPVAEFAHQLRLFFLACVLVAGLYGGATANPRIFYIQAAPAAISLIVLLLGF